MLVVDLSGPNAGGVIDGGVLEALDCGAAFSLEGQELDVELDMVAGNFFLVPRRMHRSAANLARKSAYTIALEDAINPSSEILMS